MTRSTKLTLRNSVPAAIATVTFQIAEGKKKIIKLTVPSGGSVQHPTTGDAGPWLVSASVQGSAENSAINTTASQKITDPSATINCATDLVVGRLDVNAASFTLDSEQGGKANAEHLSVLDQEGIWDLPDDAAPEILQAERALGMTMQPQTQTQWCWAAVSASVAKFYDAGSTFTQCLLANWAFVQTTCCIDGKTSKCNQPFTLDTALTHVGHLNSFLARKLSLSEVVAEIDAKPDGHPVGVRINWSDNSGHFVVIDGYNTNVSSAPMISVKDPWFGTSIANFNTFPATYQSGGTWSHSYTTH